MSSSLLGTCVTDSSSREGSPLEPEVFPAFSGLLGASQEYARISGCRFRSRSFDGLLKSDTKSGGVMRPPIVRRSYSEGDIDRASRWSAAKLDAGSAAQVAKLTAAKLAADSAVQEFATRVRSGEPQLAKELKRASRQVAEEGVRNAMVAACRRLELWPPAPAAIEACRPWGRNKLPVVAQDLYEEEMERLGGEVDWPRRMQTAAFLADFGDAVGARSAPMPEQQAVMFEGFNELVSRWEQDLSKSEADPVVSIFVSDHTVWSDISITCEADHVMN